MTRRSNMLGTQQLLDALTDHRALYHRKASVPSPSSLAQKSDAKIKNLVLQWFNGLTSDQRCSILTIFDRSWVSIILQMQKRLMKEGPGFFFLLTDVLQDEAVAKTLPSLQQSLRSDQATEAKEAKRPKRSGKSRKKVLSAPASVSSIKKHHEHAILLPGLCFRRARGLLARMNEGDVAGELLCQNVELFSSNESEIPGLDFLDTISINENLLTSTDEFLELMDSITHGQFLLSISNSQDSSWEELPWLKNMGYYTLPAFVANKIELVLWSAWLRDHRTPKNVSKGLRKIGHMAKNVSNDAAASTVCRRNQGFREWWMQQSEEVRLRTSRFAVTRAARVEIMEALPDSHGESECTEKHLSNSELEKRKCFNSLFAGLEGLQELMTSYLYPVLYGHLNSSECRDYRWLYSSSLKSANTLTDRVVRRARSALQVIMIESVKMDLLKGENFNSVLNVGCESKKKRRNRRKKNSTVLESSSLRNSENEVVQDTTVLPQEQMKEDIGIPSATGDEKYGTNEKMTEKSRGGKQKKHSKSRRKTMQECSITKNCNTKDNSHVTKEENSNLQHEMFTQVVDHHEVPADSGGTDHDPFIRDMLKDNHSVPEEKIDSTQKCTFIQEVLHSSNTVLDAASFTEGTNLSGISCQLQDSESQSLLETRTAFSDKNGQTSLQESSIQISLDTAAVCCNAGNACYDEVEMKSEDKIHFHAKPIGFESKQGLLTVINLPSTPTNVSRSSSSSHTPRERYWEGHRSHTFNSQRPTFGLNRAHEWPGTSQVRFPRGRSQIVTPATERLHLDVGRNWQQRLQVSLTALRNPIAKQQACAMPNTKWSTNKQSTFKGPECTQPFPSGFTVLQSRGYSLGPKEEISDFPFSQTSFPDLDFLSTLTKSQEELKYDDMTPNDTDCDERSNLPGGPDEHENYLISEEESERQYLDFNRDYEGDYNQYFGGGVMFWNTADFAGTGYSRPPSLSSDDSAWARHEADLSVVLDDTMGFSPAYTNVVSPRIVSTSPPTTYHPGYEYNPLSNSASRVGLALAGNDFGKFSQLPPVLSAKSDGEQVKSSHDVRKVDVDATVPDGLIRPALRPIIVVHDRSIGRKVPGSESDKAGSPHVHHRKREFPWLRRPPSPVLRCVPPPPPPPPPSPVSGFGKRKGLTSVRSGSSSPRQWGLLNSHYSEEQDVPFVLSEILESAWGNRGIRENAPIHPISGTLLNERFFAVTPLALETEHPDVALPMQTTLFYKTSDPSMQSALTSFHSIFHKEIEGFCSQVAAENSLRKISISAAVEKVSHAMRVLWPRSRLKIFGSNATGLALPCSDVDLVVCLPPVRNLEPIKEAGILEGRNGIKETCLQHAARYLADQDWVLSDTIKTIENTAIPIIMLVAYIPNVNDSGGSTNVSTSSHEVKLSEERKGPWGFHSNRQFVRLDISFESPSHTGLRTAELVRELTAQFPAIVPLALVLKQFLTVRSLDHPYTGGLSSYCLVLLITRFLQHQRHLGCPFQLNLGGLLMDFLHFFGCIFDPRRMGVSIRSGGMYVNRNHGHRIDPLHIEDPLHPSNNVGRNCFRILQCVKAFADAYSFLEKMLMEFSKGVNDLKLLPSILSSSDSSMELIVEKVQHGI